MVFPLTWLFSFLPAKTNWKGFQEVFWLQFGHGGTILLRSGQRCIKWNKILLWHKLYFQSLTFPLFTLSKESELRLCIMFCQKKGENPVQRGLFTLKNSSRFDLWFKSISFNIAQCKLRFHPEYRQSSWTCTTLEWKCTVHLSANPRSSCK